MQAEALLDHAAFVRELAKSLTFGGEDPDDVVQQTWLRAMEHPPEAGPGVKGWLATVLRNVLRQDRRSRSRRIAREAVAPPPKEMPTPDEIREREAVRSEVVTAVLDLDEPYRDVILMRYYEDLPPRKIAERTGDPVETVKTRLVRARGKLRERLDERHGGDGRTWGIAVASLALWPGEARAAPVSGGAIPFVKIAAGLVAVAVGIVLSVTMLSSPSSDAGPDRASVAKVDQAPPAVPPGAVDDEEPDAAVTASGDEKNGAAPAGESSGGGKPDPAGGKTGTGARIEGWVRDETTQAPVEGVTVRLCVREKPIRVIDVLTDEEGKYAFPDAPVGIEVWAFVNGRGRIVSAGGRLKTTELEKGQTIRQDFTTRRLEGIDLRVHLRLPEGATAPEKMRMTITSERPNATAIDYVNIDVDPESLVMTVFLAVGRHKLGFESAALRGELPPREVTGDGPPVDVDLQLERRTGIRLRLVDAEGKPLRRGPIRMLVILHVSSVDSAGNTNYSVESLGYHETDERGELDLNAILPALNVNSMLGNAFAFAFEAEGVFPGSMMTPNFEITVMEILARREQASGGPVVIDAPALPHRVMSVNVRSPDREAVEGVHVVGRPADAFADEEYVSDGKGQIVLRLLRGDAFDPRKKVERLHLAARPPWVGRVELSMLGMPEVPGGPQNALVVRREVRLVLRLVNDAGDPLAWADVKIAEGAGKTDAAGILRCAVAAGRKKIRLAPVGHIPVSIDPPAAGKEPEVRFERGREVRVRMLMPDGRQTMVPICAKVPGREEPYRERRYEPKGPAVILMVPRRAVTVMVDPRFPSYEGEVVVGADVKEVDLEIRPVAK